MHLLIEEFLWNIQQTEQILTEDDVRCQLFHFLMQNKDRRWEDFNWYELHSEIRWYGNKRWAQRPLRYRSDLVFINQKELCEFRTWSILPSKGYAFNTYKWIIEIKLRRTNGETDNEFVRKITDDIARIKDIWDKTEWQNAFYCMFIFDKKKDISNEINNIIYNQLNDLNFPNLVYYYQYLPFIRPDRH